jgi:hypothetical protein
MSFPHSARMGPWISTWVVAALLVGCRSPSDDTPSTPAPVEACVRYERALGACFHRDIPVARQPSLLPASDDERARTEALCNANLQRIQVACR